MLNFIGVENWFNYEWPEILASFQRCVQRRSKVALLRALCEDT